MSIDVDTLRIRLPGTSAARARALIEAALERAVSQLDGVASRRTLGAVELRIRIDDQADDEALIDTLAHRLVETLR